MKFGRLAFLLDDAELGVGTTELGPLWRGALGRTLRELTCYRSPTSVCADCPQVYRCTYGAMYETKPPPALAQFAQSGVSAPTVLFVSAPGNAQLVVEYTVLAHATQHIATLIEAVQRLLVRPQGLAAAHVRPTLTRILWEPRVGDPSSRVLLDPTRPIWLEPVLAAQIPPPPERIRLSSLSPIRLTHDGKPLRETSIADLTQRLLRRQHLLGKLFDLDVPGPELNALGAQLQETHRQWRFQEFSRGSSRQKRQVPMGGLHGSVDFYLPQSAHALWPWLWLGQFIHIGQSTNLGMGRYLLEPIETPEPLDLANWPKLSQTQTARETPIISKKKAFST